MNMGSQGKKLLDQKKRNKRNRTVSYDEIGENLLNLKKNKKKKTGGLDKVTREKISQPREK